MANVVIPDALLSEIGQSIEPSDATTDFVVQAVREKLQAERRRQEFLRLSEETRAAMIRCGLTEQDLLRDFELRR